MNWKERMSVIMLFLCLGILFIPLLANWLHTVVQFWGLGS